jgi:hypothetical protein
MDWHCDCALCWRDKAAVRRQSLRSMTPTTASQLSSDWLVALPKVEGSLACMREKTCRTTIPQMYSLVTWYVLIRRCCKPYIFRIVLALYIHQTNHRRPHPPGGIGNSINNADLAAKPRATVIPKYLSPYTAIAKTKDPLDSGIIGFNVTRPINALGVSRADTASCSSEFRVDTAAAPLHTCTYCALERSYGWI